MSPTRRNHWSMWWQYAVAVLFAWVFGYPLLWMLYSSIKPPEELIQHPWALPTSISFSGYQQVLSTPEFFTFYWNTIVLTLISVPLLTLVSAMAAYVFSRLRFRGSNVLFYFFLGGTMIPIHITLIPLYAMMRDLGWLNHLIAIIFPYVGFGLPVSIYILRGFFDQIPHELEEAARIDGSTTARTFWSLIIPLSSSALVTVAILSAVNTWNEYLFALTFVSANNRAYTLPLGILTMIQGLGRFSYDKMLASLSLAAVPILVCYFIAQRLIIRSLTSGALKG